jgi:spore coat polysaccharide biosynthesis protein SpsF
MTTGLIVFSRFDSRRLPGKVLRPIGGRPMLGRVLDRVRQVQRADQVVVATSDRDVDDPIDAFASAEGIAVFRGAADDVLGRCLDCAEAFSFERIVRISGDSPFMDPGVIDHLLAVAQDRSGTEVITNLFPRSFPAGISVEVLTRNVLERLASLATDDPDREHVTTYVYRHPDKFLIRNLTSDPAYPSVKLVVDDQDDLQRAEWIVGRIQGPPEAASLETIVALARAWDQQRTIDVA